MPKVFILFFLMSITITAQSSRVEVQVSDLISTNHPVFAEADAAILIREYRTVIGKYYEVFERIKIYNREGYEFATVSLPEIISNFEAAAYSLENGEIVKTTVSKDELFDEENEEGRSIKRLTFPNVTSGAIIEFSYRGYGRTRSDVDLQSGIPTLNMKIEINNATEHLYTILQNPRAYIQLDKHTEDTVMWLSAENIPPFEEEEYMYDPDMYRARISFQVKRDFHKKWFGSWNKFGRRLIRLDEYAEELKPQKIYARAINKILQGETDALKKTHILYNYIKKNFSWDELYGYFPLQGTNTTYWAKGGNLADINIMFISMLRSVDIEAFPILAATRDLGIPVNSVPNALNYILTGVEIEDELYLLDPANKGAHFNRVPIELLNWKGMIIRRNGIDWVDLEHPALSNVTSMTRLSISENLKITGETREQNSGYYSVLKNDLLMEGNDASLQELILFQYPGLEVSEVQLLENSDTMLHLGFNFEIENLVEQIGDKVYIPPLFFMTLPENPFKQEYRRYPIDFGFPKQIENTLSFEVPAGYQIDFLPEPIRIVLPNEAGSYSYQINAENNLIQIKSAYRMNVIEMPSSTYYDIQEFFKLRLNKEKEKIVLKKSN